MEGLRRSRRDVDRVILVEVVVQILLRMLQIVYDQIVRILERGALHGFGLAVLCTQHHAQLVLGRGGIVGLAEALQKFRVAECADRIYLARICLQISEIRHIEFVCHHLVDTVEVEVAAGDDRIEGGIDRLHVAVRGEDVTLPHAAIDVGEILDGIYQIGLYVGHDGERAAEERAALKPSYMPVTTCSASLKVCMASPSGIDDPGSFSRHEVGPTIRTRAAK